MSDDKREVKHALNNGIPLFDHVIRTDSGIAGSDESLFDFLNRSAWASVETARKTLEIWFARFPEEKKGDIRGRFRGDDRQHLGALMELAIHEVLRAIGTRVQVDPDFDGRSPDFAVTYQGITTVVECTVVQKSDDDFNAANRENTIKEAVNSIDTGQFVLAWRRLLPGSTQPSTHRLCNDIKNWVSSLDADEEMARLKQGYGPREMEFCFGNEWKLRLGAIPVGSGNLGEEDKRAIGVEVIGGGFRQDDSRLRVALAKKAGKYRYLDSPYLIVAGSAIVIADFEDMLTAMVGREVPRPYVEPHGTEIQDHITYRVDGLLGSRSRPRNRHVSAVLYKPRLGNIWTVCGTDDPWQLVHNPWAKAPLPSGMFTFATEWVLESNGFVNIKPTSTLNSVLGLPDPWPGSER